MLLFSLGFKPKINSNGMQIRIDMNVKYHEINRINVTFAL